MRLFFHRQFGKVKCIVLFLSDKSLTRFTYCLYFTFSDISSTCNTCFILFLFSDNSSTWLETENPAMLPLPMPRQPWRPMKSCLTKTRISTFPSWKTSTNRVTVLQYFALVLLLLLFIVIDDYDLLGLISSQVLKLFKEPFSGLVSWYCFTKRMCK